MLVHHPDAKLARSSRVFDAHLFAIPDNLALICLCRPINNFHQGAFTGPVFT